MGIGNEIFAIFNAEGIQKHSDYYVSAVLDGFHIIALFLHVGYMTKTLTLSNLNDTKR